MKRSLSVLLPVRNREAELDSLVGEALDLGSDLASDVDVVVIDLDSSDDTVDVAYDLAARYQQVRVVRHPRGAKAEAAFWTGLPLARGATILYRADDCPFPLSESGKLWRAMAEYDLAMAASETESLGVFSKVRRALSDDAPQAARPATLCVMKRRVAEQLRPRANDPRAFLARLDDSGVRHCRLPVGDAKPSRIGGPRKPHLMRSARREHDSHPHAR